MFHSGDETFSGQGLAFPEDAYRLENLAVPVILGAIAWWLFKSAKRIDRREGYHVGRRGASVLVGQSKAIVPGGTPVSSVTRPSAQVTCTRSACRFSPKPKISSGAWPLR
jgi:hypothetical protein